MTQLFWNKFSPTSKYIYLSTLAVFVLCLLGYSVAYFVGASAVIGWQTNSSLEALPVLVDSFSRNLFTFKVEVESMFVKELFQGSEVRINLWSAYLYSGLLLIAYVLGITVLTFLSRTWYMVGMGIVIFILANLNLELLNIFGQQNKYPLIAIIIAYIGLSYYFFSFNKNISFVQRLLAFALLTLGVSVLIKFGTSVQSTALFFSNYGIFIPVLISMAFIGITGFDVMAFFLSITAGNRSKGDQRRLINFSMIALLYLGNLFLVFLRKFHIVYWDILYINMFFLQATATVVGIWGYRRRAVLNKTILPFAPLGALLYLCYAIIAHATMAYAFITGNDPLVKCFEFAILIAHLSFGTLFFIYVLGNFSFLFNKDLSIYDVVYHPQKIPFFTVYTGGAIGVLSLFMKLNMYPYFLALAGYYNGLGDFYKHEGDNLLAKEYYFSGVASDRQNHRSNYSLASMYGLEGNAEKEQEFYASSLSLNASEYSYVNMANFYLKEGMLLQAMFTLNDGLKEFPESGAIASNLGTLYAKTDASDSTFYYLNQAITNLREPSVPVSNSMYQLVLEGRYADADTFTTAHEVSDSKLPFINNKLALYNILGKKYEPSLPVLQNRDSISPFEYSCLLNKGINDVKMGTQLSVADLDSLLSKSGNSAYSSGLVLLKALNLYYSNQKRSAVVMLSDLYNATTSNLYSKILAVWFYEQEAYDKSYLYFKNTIEAGGQEAVLNCCMALCEAGKFDEAKENLTVLATSKSNTIQSIASRLLKIIEAQDVATIAAWNDELKFQYLHLKHATLPTASMDVIVNSIDTLFYQNLAKSEWIQEELERGNRAVAEGVWNSIKDMPGENNFEKGVLNYTSLQLLVAQKNWAKLATVTKNIYLNSDKKNQIDYFKALALDGMGKSKEAHRYYLSSVQAAPFYAKALVATAEHMNKMNETVKAYELLSEAVRLDQSSVLVLQAYVLQALKLNLLDYAEDAMKSLSSIMDKEQYDAFRRKVDGIKQTQAL